MSSLPLLVVRHVLVPGGQLPLHLVDQRDISLLADLVRDQEVRSPEFGVIGSAAEGPLFAYGTVARLVAVSDEEDHLSALALGGQRFRLDRIDSASPYLRGEVTPLDEPDGEAPTTIDVLTMLVRRELTSYLTAIGATRRLSEDPWLLAHEIGAALALGLEERQQLLCCPDTASRLLLGLRHVRREQSLFDTFAVVPAGEWPETGLN